MLKNNGVRIVESRAAGVFAGETLLAYLTRRFPYHSGDEWREKILAGELLCENARAVPGLMLAEGAHLRYTPLHLEEPPAELSYRVVFEDERLLLLDKPGNLPSHPAGPYFRHTLWYLLNEAYPEIHLVNRLDRETSGLLLAAKDARAAKFLSSHIFLKKYLALVHGVFDAPCEARGFLVRDAASCVRKKRRFVRAIPPGEKGDVCATAFLPLRSADGLTLLNAELLGTGRTHQIRATLLALGFPLAGDKLYGLDERLYLRQRKGALSAADRALLRFPRQALHSAEIGFFSPSDARKMSFSVPLPPDLLLS